MENKEKLLSENEIKPSESDIAFNSNLDTLYTHEFKNQEGKFLNIVTEDEETGLPKEIDINFPYPKRNRIKITLTFIKKQKDINSISFKKFKHYKNDGWQEVETEQITFSYFTFKKLIAFLRFLSDLNLEGINERKIALSNDDLSEIDNETKSKIKTFLIQKDGPKIIEELLNSGLITSSDIVNIGYRKKELEIFDKLLNDPNYINIYKRENQITDPRIEITWQHFFNKNDWIFGYGLDYKFLGILQKEVHISNTDLKGKDAVIGDFLLGCNKFTTLVELKKPNTPLFKNNQNRANSWCLSNDLINSFSQILEQKADWQVQAESNANNNFNDKGEIIRQKTVDPKTILIIGHSNQYAGELKESQIKAKSFELFRRDSRNVKIITYDELFERAKFIVENKETIQN
ncbi:MAG: Shedu immune nuclease family protein [Patescibacteria group bacterium]